MITGLPWWLSGKESTCNGGDMDGKIPQKRKCHSSILAWETPWTEEPGGLLSMELQKSWT